MEIEELTVSLGLDTKDIDEGLKRLGLLNKFIGTMLKGYVDASNGAIAEGRQFTQGFAKFDNLMRVWSQKCEQAGEEAEEAMGRAGRGADKAGRQTSDAGKKASEMGRAFMGMGMRWGRVLKGVAMRFIAPLIAGFSIGGIIKSFTGDIAQVAQMTGYYTGQMEAWYKKRAMLARVTREDLELYRKGRFAVMNFQIEMANLSSTIMHNLSPAFRKGIELLNAITDWLKRNRTNIIRFIAVVAGTITTLLLPAFAKLAVAVLANPLTWLVGIFIALILIVDDFVTYLRGGKTALGGFWSMFGNASEIVEKLEKAFKKIKDAVKAVFSYLLGDAKTVIGYFSGVVAPIKAVLAGIVGIIDGLLSGDKDKINDSIMEIVDALPDLGDLFGKAFAKAIGFIRSEVIKFMNWLAGQLPSVLPWLGRLAGKLIVAAAKGIVAGVKHIIKAFFTEQVAEGTAASVSLAGAILEGLWGALKAFYEEIDEGFSDICTGLWDSLCEGLDEALEAVKEKWQGVLDWLSGKFGWLADAAGTIAGKLGFTSGGEKAIPKTNDVTAATVNNVANRRVSNSNRNVNINGINIYTDAKDANGIAKEIDFGIKNEFSKSGVFASEGSIQQT